MTSMGAIKVQDQEQPEEGLTHIVCVADSQSTVVQRGRTFDRAKKLSVVGDSSHILMGTGRSDQIGYVTHVLQSNAVADLQAAAGMVLQVAKDRNWRWGRHDGLQFVIAGPNGESGLDVVSVDCKTKEAGIGNGITFQGSGTRFVEQYHEGASEAGRHLFPTDVVDAFALAYDFAKKGAKDMGVNDKLQYGIITPSGIVTLYHPDVAIVVPAEYKAYVKSLAGLDLSQYDDVNDSTRVDAWKAQKGLDAFFHALFTSVELDARNVVGTRQGFAYQADQWRDGKISDDNLKAARDMTREARTHLHDAVEALLSQDVGRIKAYIKDHQARQRNLYDTLLA